MPETSATPLAAPRLQHVARAARTSWRALTVPAPQGAVPSRWRENNRLRWLPQALACAFVAVLLPVTVQVLTNNLGLSGGLAGALAVSQTVPLLWAPTRPLLAWWVIFVSDVAGALVLLGTPPGKEGPWPWPPMELIGYLVVCLGLALRERRATVVAVFTVTTVVSVALGLGTREHAEDTNVLLVVLSGVVLALGTALRERVEAGRELAQERTISEAERASRTLLEERARIARELHDVVAHHMSVITVQADSAPYRLSGLPPAAEAEFASLAATARESLSEMRRLLGVLRSAQAAGERIPQPGLERLPQLVEATVRGGVPVELSRQHAPAPEELPHAVSMSAYRIVQEALANVVRHAPGARTQVSLHAVEGRLDVLVLNGPSPHPESAPLESADTGHGLVGMRERVRLLDGALDTHPLPDGGFLVAARLPLSRTGEASETGPDGAADRGEGTITPDAETPEPTPRAEAVGVEAAAERSRADERRESTT